MSEAQQSVRIGRPPTTIDGQLVPERLLDQACKLFAEKGFDRTSVQDVVAAAGVTKGAMYHYFRSKDDLLYEIYARVLRVQTEHLERFVNDSAPPEVRVRDACADVVVTTAENLESTTVFFRSLQQLTEEKQAEIRAERRRYHDMFVSMIAEGQRAGVFRTDVTPDMATDFFFGSVHHLPMWYQPAGPMTAQQVGDQFAEMFVSGLLVGAAPTARSASSA